MLCGLCKGFLHDVDGDSECATFLGRAHAGAVLTDGSRSFCKSMSLSRLSSRVDLFHHGDPSARSSHLSPPLRGNNGQLSYCSLAGGASTACKRCLGNSAPSEQRVRLFKPIFPHPKERWWAQTHSRSQTSEQLAYAPVIQDDDDLAHICPEDWFLTMDLKDAYIHIHIAPLHKPFLRFAFTVLPFGLSRAPCNFYEVHPLTMQRGSVPFQADGNPRIELPRRLACSSWIRMGTECSQICCSVTSGWSSTHARVSCCPDNELSFWELL